MFTKQAIFAFISSIGVISASAFGANAYLKKENEETLENSTLTSSEVQGLKALEEQKLQFVIKKNNVNSNISYRLGKLNNLDDTNKEKFKSRIFMCSKKNDNLIINCSIYTFTTDSETQLTLKKIQTFDEFKENVDLVIEYKLGNNDVKSGFDFKDYIKGDGVELSWFGEPEEDDKGNPINDGMYSIGEIKTLN